LTHVARDAVLRYVTTGAQKMVSNCAWQREPPACEMGIAPALPIAPGERIPMSIAEICNREVVCATRNTTVLEAASLMRQRHVGDIVIVDEDGDRRWAIGIVTDRDIVVEVVAAGLDPRLVKLSDLMLEPLTIVEQHVSLAQTIRTMQQKGVRRMPVVDAQGALLGIVTLDDLLAHLAPPLADLGTLVGQTRQKEMRKRK